MKFHVRSAATVFAVLAMAGGALVATSDRSATATSKAAVDVPTPQQVLGFEACADYRLASYEQITRYFRELDTASPRMQMSGIGRTTEGRQMQLAVISSEENLKSFNLVRYQEIARRLARAKDLTDKEARQLSYNGKAVVWVDYGIHTTENASQQAAMMFAHRLVSDNSPEFKHIRDNVITLVVPSMNPDGNTMIADWYRENRGQRWELSLPELYQHYAGHDNNRDWYMFNLRRVAQRRQAALRGVDAADHPQQPPDRPVPVADLHPAVRGPAEPADPAAGDARRQPGRRRDVAPARPGGQGGRGLARPVRHLVERRHALGALLPQHGGDPDRDLAHQPGARGL